MLRDLIPVIRRFTGGGTVIVDSGTIFTMLICNKDVPGVQPYPHPVMSWTGQLHGEVFHGFRDFHLRENGMWHGYHSLRYGYLLLSYDYSFSLLHILIVC